MKALLFTLMLAVSLPAYAWGDREQGIVAGALGAIVLDRILRPQPPQQYPPVQYPPVPVVPYYPGTIYPDYIYRPMYKEVQIFVPECNCYRTVLVQVN